MCTIVLAWRELSDAPVAIAANRDEALDRESRSPRLLEDDPQVVAPQDARAGGTWIGVSERGLVVAITNRWTEPPDESDGAERAEHAENADDPDDPEDVDDADAGPEEDRRSRGLLVRDALRAGDADAALEVVREAVATGAYAGFNLLVADAERATYLEWDGAATTDGADSSLEDLRERDLDPGVHAIVTPGLNDVDERAARLRSELGIEGAAPAAGTWLDGAASRLGDHEYGVCVHADGFGTRSASLLATFEPRGDADAGGAASDGAGGDEAADDEAASDGERATRDDDGTDSSAPVPAAYAFADGPPCETRFEQVDPGRSFLEGSF